jgi:hypothetical protein
MVFAAVSTETLPSRLLDFDYIDVADLSGSRPFLNFAVISTETLTSGWWPPPPSAGRCGGRYVVPLLQIQQHQPLFLGKSGKSILRIPILRIPVLRFPKSIDNLTY